MEQHYKVRKDRLALLLALQKKENNESCKFNTALNSTLPLKAGSLFPKLQNRLGQGYQGTQDFTDNTS
jgi:hypothetical protein